MPEQRDENGAAPQSLRQRLGKKPLVVVPFVLLAAIDHLLNIREIVSLLEGEDSRAWVRAAANWIGTALDRMEGVQWRGFLMGVVVTAGWLVTAAYWADVLRPRLVALRQSEGWRTLREMVKPRTAFGLWKYARTVAIGKVRVRYGWQHEGEGVPQGQTLRLPKGKEARLLFNRLHELPKSRLFVEVPGTFALEFPEPTHGIVWIDGKIAHGQCRDLGAAPHRLGPRRERKMWVPVRVVTRGGGKAGWGDVWARFRAGSIWWMGEQGYRLSKPSPDDPEDPESGG